MMISPYGSWQSPITSDLIVTEAVGLVDVLLDGDDLYWIESRPNESGRLVVVRRTADGALENLTPAPFSARTRVHETGGAAVTIDRGILYFSNFQDQQLYRHDPGDPPIPITKQRRCRYADSRVDRARARLICVREEHGDGEAVRNTLVAVSVDGRTEEVVLTSGYDFYSTPRISFDGTRLAWLSWNHPRMPWTGTELWLAQLTSSGSLAGAVQIGGGDDESIFQPEWSPDGRLYFVSDRSGWWNIYRYHSGRVEAMLPMEAEFGRPQWSFGGSTYGFASESKLIATYTSRGQGKLGILNLEDGHFQEIDLPYHDFANLRVNGQSVGFLGGAPDKSTSVIRLDLSTMRTDILRNSTEVAEDPALRVYFSFPEPIEFPTEGGLHAYAFFYPPNNPGFCAPPDELPPLIVKSHGGPTAATSSTLDLRLQYWTSRGFAVVDVDYGGSTGYGREYRNRLHRNWGIVDVDDCINAAKFLASKKKVDPARVAIRGSSAGGYTTLCALTFKDYFRIGASHYGICDLEALARDTHKFELHYMDWLVGKYPEEQDVYRKRSPIHHVDGLSVPVVFFQGDQDTIVPPNQAEMMVNAIRAKGLPFGYFIFHGEQHGFRRAENIRRALDAELYFYSTLLVRSGLRF
jgi:dipeptidyl aminopeptidase/acylaminoacyl peptidase